ncbi:hypothetical protein U879_08560 [Defluviimonas sp. 20V17]|uniref:Membrane fusion protein (MFP) family protein n=1 Tax=Allgaiera indica TaxID=765699 RepID=A0AAN4UN91_9RHOB|nr:HlyD family type I secretion periplasmic adaptor subunit [Allgaiera indica]KDB04097.1 hypothetical protein U879_08560 [Defluviimonas sp. 20V17]GHD98535.1 hypothetical protein GCM10008024_02440 [Allgaiera indica]SDW11571.1 HlyD family secretion protein [Allgaiera indica]
MTRFRLVRGDNKGGDTPAEQAERRGSDLSDTSAAETGPEALPKAVRVGDRVTRKLAQAETTAGQGTRARSQGGDRTPSRAEETPKEESMAKAAAPVPAPGPSPDPEGPPPQSPSSRGLESGEQTPEDRAPKASPVVAARDPRKQDHASRPPPGQEPTDPPEPRWGAAWPAVIGILAVVILFGGFGFWAVQARIAGAVVAPGRIEVESNRQVVQHPQGGVVGKILVQDGSRVKAGQLLLTLDGSRTRSELAIVEGQLRELAARRARLRAERDGLKDVAAIGDLPDWIRGDPGFAGQMESERTLFKARLEALTQQVGLIDEQNAQVRNRVSGTQAELASVKRQAGLIETALADQQKLLSQGLAQSSRVLDLRTKRETLLGQVAQLQAKIADLKGQIAANEIQKLQLTTKRREEAVSQLRDIQYKEVELSEKRLSLKDTLSRLEIRAPVSGIVYDSRVFTVNSVVQPAAPLMYIIPQNQPLVVQARVDGTHIDDIHLGQKVSLRFPAFDQRTTAPIEGKLIRISADVLTDPTTHQNYYAATIEPDKAGLAKLGPGMKLVPGMPAEAFIETGSRSPMTYLLHPLVVYFDKAFRE